jgi:hypothetical protein
MSDLSFSYFQIESFRSQVFNSRNERKLTAFATTQPGLQPQLLLPGS